MELKSYQKRVLRDLDDYLALIDETHNLSEAYRAHWASRNIAVGIHGLPLYNNQLAGVPHVCLKVPTGGGKTLLGCAALHHIFSWMGECKTKAVVWLVPSNAILEQTIHALTSIEHPYRKWLDTDFGSRVEIYTGEQAKNGQNLSPSTVQEQLSIFILSYDSLRITRKEGRKAYQENGALAQFVPHYTQRESLIPDVDDSALIQVINQLSPVVIVDESHNAQSDLSIEMLRNLNPSLVLDLTATPRKNSNIISIVDARELKRENMVKLPVIVYNRSTKQDVLVDAIQLRASIEAQAKVQEAHGGDYIRPIVLFQAQPKGKESGATFEKLKSELVELGIPKEEIAIKTSEINELRHVDLMSRSCPIRYIITVNALKEGWDCPFAYVLATLANRTSQVDVEQIVGRILRLPHTRKHGAPLLNMSYVLTCSNDFRTTVENVIKGLNRAGFSDKEFRIGSDEVPAPEVMPKQQTIPVVQNEQSQENTEAEQNTRPTQDEPTEEFLNIDFVDVKARLEEKSPNNSTTAPSAVAEMTAAAEKAGEAFEAETTAAEADGIPLMGGSDLRRHIVMHTEYEDDALSTVLPVFVETVEESLFQEGTTRKVSQTTLMQGFTLADKDTQINFAMSQGDVAMVDVRDDERPKRIALAERDAKQFKSYIDMLPSDRRKEVCIDSIYKQLDRIDVLSSGDLKKYIVRVVDQMTTDELAAMESAIPAYTAKIKSKIQALMAVHRERLFSDKVTTGEIYCVPSFTLPKIISPVETMLPMNKSLYTDEASVNNFEYEVIMAIAALDNVRWWHRNIERHGMCLNGFINHYPDFIVKTMKGNVVLIETKGDDRDNSDSRAKLELGKKWAASAGRGYSYFMVFDERETGFDGAYTVSAFIEIMKRL